MKIAVSRKNLWEKMPPFAKVALGKALNILPTPYIIGKKYRETMQFLDESQWWSSQQNLEYQLKELQRICILANKQTEYYRSVFSQFGFDPTRLTSKDYFEKLPFIDRETIRDNLDKMCTVSVKSPKVDYITTGGTTGAPLCFYTTSDRSQVEYAYLNSGWSRAGFYLGLPVGVFRGKIVKKNAHGIFHEFDPVFNNNYYSSFHLTDENMDKYLRHIATLGPCYLHVYPSSIYCLARFLRRTGSSSPANIKGIFAESEIVYQDQKEMVQELFGCRYFSSYGHTEKLVAAVECEHSSYYHVWPTYGYFELIDDKGKNITTPGKRGEIVGTGFINDVVPFIRYRTGDFATYVGPECSKCGRAHIVIKDVRGHRVQEELVAKDGSSISWTAVNMHDDTFDNVLRFQFYQDIPGVAELRVVPLPGFSKKDIERMQQNLGAKFVDRLIFNIKKVDDINLSPSGKSIFVDQNIQ